jgi:hypothetical protein
MLPPVELPPVPAPAVPAPVVEPVPPAVIERLPTPPVERAPVEVPAVPAAPVERAEPSRVERPTAPPEKATPREFPAAPPPAPAIERAQPRVPDRDSPSRPEPAPRSPAAAPADRDSDIFRKGPAAPPAAADKGAAPRIDLEAARKRAREIAREGSGQRAILPFPMPPQEERKSKEALALEKALKPDCRKAYQGLGLLAVVPLIANEFGEGSCRW